MKPRKLRANEVTFSVEIEAEDIPVRGNAMASGDDAADRECEDEIIARLDRGEVEAWCAVVVKATWKGYSATASIGACTLDRSYTTEDVIDGHDLRGEALESLNEQIASEVESLSELMEAP